MHVTYTVAAGSDSGRGFPAGRLGPPVSTMPARRIIVVSRLIIACASIAVVAIALAAGIGYRWVRQSEDRLAFEQHTALRNAISEFQSSLATSEQPDLRLIRKAEQIVGLKNIRFTRDLNEASHEIAPVVTAGGRIAGFFVWDRSHPRARAMQDLASVAAVIAFVLISLAAISLLLLKRARAELALKEAEAARAADEDKLTGLPNHAKTLELLDHALAVSAETDCTTFALIELDGMDDITAQHGVLGGDELVVAVARRLKEALPINAVCGRVASDEFAIILTAGPQNDAEAIIRGVLDSIVHPHWIDGVIRVSAHAGFAQTPHYATTRVELTRCADLALRAAFKRGPGAVVKFDVSIDIVSTDQKFIHRELPRAVSANEFELYYQPIVASHGGRMVGVEALLRWNHPQRGTIAPAMFIPVAEQMGLMDTIGAFALRRALDEAKRWPEELYVAVNLSPLQVRDRTIVDLVRSTLMNSAVTPSRLVLEITEGVLIDNPDEMVGRIKDLHDLGVRIALDDFGSGYSNLGYLQRFPLDKLKIDKSFVAALGRSSNGGVIIQAIVALGRALGLTVLVEGVETEHQRVLLRLAGCDEMQGFLFANAAPAKTIDKLLAQAKYGGKPLAASDQALTA